MEETSSFADLSNNAVCLGFEGFNVVSVLNVCTSISGELIALRRPNHLNISAARSAINFIASIPGVNDDVTVSCAAVLNVGQMLHTWKWMDRVGKAVILKEVTLVQSLLSSFLSRAVDNAQSYDIISLTSVEGRDGLVVAVSSTGVLRVWDVVRKKCISLTALNDTLNGDNAGPITVSACIPKAQVQVTSEGQSVLVVSVAYRSAPLNVVEGRVGSPLREEEWQVLLLASRFDASSNSAERLTLVAQPVLSRSERFVIPSLNSADNKTIEVKRVLDTLLSSSAADGGITLTAAWLVKDSSNSSGVERAVTISTLSVNSFAVLDTQNTPINALPVVSHSLYSTKHTQSVDIETHTAYLANEIRSVEANLYANQTSFEELVQKTEANMSRYVFLSRAFAPHVIFHAVRQMAPPDAQSSAMLCTHLHSITTAAHTLLDALRRVTLTRYQQHPVVVGSIDREQSAVYGDDYKRALFLSLFVEVYTEFLVMCESEQRMFDVNSGAQFSVLNVQQAAADGDAMQADDAVPNTNGDNLLLLFNRGQRGLLVNTLEADKNNATLHSASRHLLTLLENHTDFPQFDSVLGEASSTVSAADGVQIVSQALFVLSSQLQTQYLEIVSSFGGQAENSNTLLTQLEKYVEPSENVDFATPLVHLLNTPLSSVKTAHFDATLQLLLTEYLQRTKVVAVFLSLLTHSGGNNSNPESEASREQLAGKITTRLLYLHTLLSLAVSRPTQDAVLRNNVEISSLFKLLCGHGALNVASSTPDSNISVLSNFSAFCVEKLQVQNGSDVVVQTITDLLSGRENVAFTLYLLSVGQFAAADQWSSSLQAVHNANTNVNTNNNTMCEIARQITNYSSLSATKAEQEINTLTQTLCRVHDVYAERALTVYTQNQDSNATAELLSLIDDNQERTLTSGVNQRSVEDVSLSVATFCEAATLDLVGQKKARPHADHTLTNENITLLDTVQYLRGRSLFSVLFSMVWREMLAATPSAGATELDGGAVEYLIANYTPLLNYLFAVYQLVDSIELFERMLHVLPNQCGVNQIIALCGQLVSLLESLLSVVNTTAQTDSSVFIGALQSQLYTCWLKVFEYSLVSDSDCGAALDAVLRLVDLTPHLVGYDRQVQLTDRQSSRITWKECMHALVNHACDFGHLHWLCALPDVFLVAAHTSLADAVTAELEVLAAFDEGSSSSGVGGAFYSECLLAYFLSRDQLHGAATVSERASSLRSSGEAHLESSFLAVATQCLEASSTLKTHDLLNRGHGRDTITAVTSSNHKGVHVAPSVSIVDRAMLIERFVSAVSRFDLVARGVSPVTVDRCDDRQLLSLLSSQGGVNAALTLARSISSREESRTAESDAVLETVLLSLLNQCEDSFVNPALVTRTDVHQSAFATPLSSGLESRRQFDDSLWGTTTDLVASQPQWIGDKKFPVTLLATLYAVLSHHIRQGVDVVSGSGRATIAVTLEDLRALGLERCDSADLIYSFLTHGDHAAACVFMSDMLTRNAAAAGRGGAYVYYNLVDVVISAAESALAAGQDSQDLRGELG
eukprot:gene22314-28432_t